MIVTKAEIHCMAHCMDWLLHYVRIAYHKMLSNELLLKYILTTLRKLFASYSRDASCANDTGLSDFHVFLIVSVLDICFHKSWTSRLPARHSGLPWTIAAALPLTVIGNKAVRACYWDTESPSKLFPGCNCVFPLTWKKRAPLSPWHVKLFLDCEAVAEVWSICLLQVHWCLPCRHTVCLLDLRKSLLSCFAHLTCEHRVQSGPFEDRVLESSVSSCESHQTFLN